MGIELVPEALRARFRFDERNHATAVLASDFPNEFADILVCLGAFTLKRSDIIVGGKGRSAIPIAIDGFLVERDWAEKKFQIEITADGQPIPIPTHKIDNFKNRVGVEVEWNNKTEFFDRDLNNFRLLNGLNVLSVGVIITRISELQKLFNDLGIGKKYGKSTTHWDKLIPKIDGGGAGQCPILMIGIGTECYNADL
jgi:hypothetical protein